MLKISLITTLIITLSTLNVWAEERQTQKIDQFIEDAVAEGQFPGAQVVVGNSNGIIYSKSYGHKDWSEESKVDSTSLYDLASLTKVFATTLSIMTLIERGQLTLDSTLGELLGLCDTLPQSKVRVEELLSHTSGYAPGLPPGFGLVTPKDTTLHLMTRRKSKTNPTLYDTSAYLAKELQYDTTYLKTSEGEDRIMLSEGNYLKRSFLGKIDSMALAAYRAQYRDTHIYSDLNFYLLQKIIEKIVAAPLDNYTRQIYDRMEICALGYNPLQWSSADQICPTEYDKLLRRDTIRGRAHDDLAALQGGVSGNAGLFGSALSAAQICGMFLRHGVAYNGEPIVDSITIAQFTMIRRTTAPQKKSTYGLGFTKIDDKERPYTPQSYGHSGYTGTYFWIDPSCDLFLVILTNRVHPTRTNKKFNPDSRAKLWELTTQIFR